MVNENESKAPINASGINVYCSYDVIVKIADLHEHSKNPNKHTDTQIALLAKIIKEQGWRNPIVVSNRSGFITKGHARLGAAKQLGLLEVPVDRQDYKNEQTEIADMVADNRIAELADMDLPDVKRIIEELMKDGFDTDLTGYDKEAIQTIGDAFMTDIPDANISKELETNKSDGRIILVFHNDEEKEFWKNRLDYDGEKTTLTIKDI